jgi:hypothetical protein
MTAWLIAAAAPIVLAAAVTILGYTTGWLSEPRHASPRLRRIGIPTGYTPDHGPGEPGNAIRVLPPTPPASPDPLPALTPPGRITAGRQVPAARRWDYDLIDRQLGGLTPQQWVDQAFKDAERKAANP